MNNIPHKPDNAVRVFMGGDVMTGRLIDRLFPVHCAPVSEPAESIARTEELLQTVRAAHDDAVPHDYIWGFARDAVDAAKPDFRLANLETSITTCSEQQDKRYTFRMHPENIACLTAMGFDCLSLANNHSLDFGRSGLVQTLVTLEQAGIAACGAGLSEALAAKPAIHDLPGGGRILVFGWGFASSGIPETWAVARNKPGIQYIADITAETAAAMARQIAGWRRPGDIVIASLHWGDNWVSTPSDAHRALARLLVDRAGVDVVHGHSAHHLQPAEIHNGKLIIYDSGDLIDDYAGTAGPPQFRHHMGALFFADIDPATGRAVNFFATPVRRASYRLETCDAATSQWIQGALRGDQASSSTSQ